MREFEPALCDARDGPFQYDARVKTSPAVYYLPAYVALERWMLHKRVVVVSPAGPEGPRRLAAAGAARVLVLGGQCPAEAGLDVLPGPVAPEALPLRDASVDAIAWLEGVPRDEPVHLLLNYFDAHWPYKPPKGFDTFPGATDPADAAADWESSQAAEARGRDDKTQQSVLARYDGEILYVDHHIGRLLEALRRLGRFGGNATRARPDSQRPGYGPI